MTEVICQLFKKIFILLSCKWKNFASHFHFKDSYSMKNIKFEAVNKHWSKQYAENVYSADYMQKCRN